MPVKILKDFLESNQIQFKSIVHSPAYTAQEVAESIHLSGHEVAKTVMVLVEDNMVMIVLPASSQVDFIKLQEQLGTQKIALATEAEFSELFPSCEVGAMPPFGNLFDMPVYVSEKLRRDESIAFAAGSDSEVIQLKYKDFEKLVKPKVLSI